MIDPVVTYRIQFHKNFTFKHLEDILPYLQQLGVQTIYASPIFESVPGSMHGYDGVNPHRINPEIGNEEDLRRLSTLLREQNMKWVQDIVPNHMAFHKNNLWLMDVLEKGRNSVYSNFFDLAWAGDLFHGRIIIPVLGESLEDALFNKEIQIAYEHQRLVIKFFDHCYPLNPRSYRVLLEKDQAPDAVQLLTDQIANLHQEDDPVRYSLGWHELLLQLDALMQNPIVNSFITDRLDRVNHDGIQLRQILDDQTYSLTRWQITDKRITFRRFFTVNELIGVNIQDEKVFEHYHLYIKKLLDEDIIHGLRIDHIDGLLDPQQYLVRLKEFIGDDKPVWVEKILKPAEELPSWPMQGATGYEFMAWVNQVMTHSPAYKTFNEQYKKLTGRATSLELETYEKKSHILHNHMLGELDNLYQLFIELNLAGDRALNEKTRSDLKQCIGEFLICCPVYRYYGNSFPLSQEETKAVASILTSITNKKPELADAAGILSSVLFGSGAAEDSEYSRRVTKFYQRCMQFTGPLMAKGFEDTLFYTYNLFIGHNEVGDSPEPFGLSTETFHTLMAHRQKRWPLSLNATSTHDTKRGEDARARLNVITEIPEEWIKAVDEFVTLADPLKTDGIPDANDSYFIFQTLIGTYPLSHEDTYGERIEKYLIKALRESKQNSDWAAPDENYENHVISFIHSLLRKDTPFNTVFRRFLDQVVDGGLINSIVQVVLKFTCPGVPDIYQGCEGLDYSLVDPDNRQLIDYREHLRALRASAEIENGKRLLNLWGNRYDGRIKQWITKLLCTARSQQSTIFEQGEYVPLEVKGKFRKNVLAFARVYEGDWAITVVPLFSTQLARQQNSNVHALNWDDTTVELPAGVPFSWTNVFTDSTGSHNGKLMIAKIFDGFPAAVLVFKKKENSRGAGILLPISSLPSSFGIGDLGPSAYKFVDFLKASGQRYWQLLPLNPTSSANGHSPYSSYSSMAGNTLLVSPELLMKKGWISNEQIDALSIDLRVSVNYCQVTEQKELLLQQAWNTFLEQNDPDAALEFNDFIVHEDYWLEDFALYVVLKAFHKNEPWDKWLTSYKQRDAKSLKTFANKYQAEIRKVKWDQFVFHKQWQELKQYCHTQNIKLFGDLPFYVVFDSADVWANPKNFMIDAAGKVQYVAGVPPDYFNESGQLWGMPIFDWEYLHHNEYSWWLQRIQKNMEMFDLLRLDHFRAFAGYWQVPSDARTAVDGEWINGPGKDFFTALYKMNPALQFIAEDLGEITPDVYALRDDFKLPGMKVLHFAFGKGMAQSTYIPHNFEHSNFVVYTGTHDNNTTRGWYEHDINPEIRELIAAYMGWHVDEKNITDSLIRLAYGSTAKLAIIPIQDILDLDHHARINTPGTANNNWTWRLEKIPDHRVTTKLLALTKLYNRL